MKVEGWFRDLDGERLEVFLRCDGHRLRASGPAAYVERLVAEWESSTGLRVDGLPTRVVPRRGSTPPPGQLAFVSAGEDE